MNDYNKIFNKFRFNSIKHTVSVSELLKNGTCVSYEDLLEAVNNALKNNKNCFIGFFSHKYKINNLHQLAALFYAFGIMCNASGSYKDYYNYLYDIFITKSLDGFKMEEIILQELSGRFPNLRRATAYEDSVYGVDLVSDGVCGIQVKPISYLKYNSQEELNKKKNKAFKLPVHYAYYDKNNKTYKLIINN